MTFLLKYRYDFKVAFNIIDTIGSEVVDRCLRYRFLLSHQYHHQAHH